MQLFKHLIISGTFLLFLFCGSSCEKTTSCSTVSGLASSYISSTSILLKWSSVSNATYTIQYRVVGTSAWLYTTSAANSVTLNGLQAGSSYEWQVKTDCTNNVSAFTSSSTFNTTSSVVAGSYVGTYNVKETDVDQNGNLTTTTYIMQISANQNTTDSITITNFAHQGNNLQFSAAINGNQFSVAGFNITGGSVTSSFGTLSGDSISFSYGVNYTNGNSQSAYDVGVR